MKTISIKEANWIEFELADRLVTALWYLTLAPDWYAHFLYFGYFR